MNIMFLFDLPIIANKGGVQRVTDVLAKEFVRRGHKVCFLCISPTEHQDTIVETNDSCEQYYLSDKSNLACQARDLAEMLKINVVINQSFSKEVVSILNAIPNHIFKISVFHNQPFATYKKERFILRGLTTTNSLIGSIFKYAGICAPYLVRGYYIKKARNIFSKLIDASDKYCLLSQRFFKRIKQFVPEIPDSKLVAINNPNTFPDNVLSDDIRENIILFVGRIENSSKNVYDFIRVCRILMKRNPDWRAVVVGDGSDLQKMKLFAQKSGVVRISFEGNQSDVGTYYAKAKFVCCTSNYEGWCMVLTEAMQFGCVPVSYNTFESVSDIIDDRENGFIVDKKPAEMARRIQECIDGKFNLVQISQRARQKVTMFSVANIVDQWESLIKNRK